MELWIRTQTKTGIFKVDSVYYAGIDKNKYIIYFKDIRLGIYKDEKRALEVLDEIQNIIKPKYLLDSSSIKPNGDSWVENGMIMQKYSANARIEELSSYVYEMPQE